MDTQAYYAKRAKYYEMINAHKYNEAKEEVHFYKKELKRFNRNAKTVLDIGCGTGRLSIPLSIMGFKVTGIDNSKEMLAIAKKEAGASNRNLRLELADLRTYRPKEKFDCVICGDASLATFMSRKRLVRVLKKIGMDLKEGGVFFYDVWNYMEYGGWPPVVRRTASGGDTEISIVRRTSVDSHGIYRFSDRLGIDQNGRHSIVAMTYTSKVWRRDEWISMFKEAGFKTLKTYSNLKHIKRYDGVPDRLYFVALK